MNDGQRINLLDFDQPALRSFFADLGERPFRAQQAMQWIYQRGCRDFDAMTDMSKSLRATLAKVAEIAVPEVDGDQRSTDGTRKWLLRLRDGNAVETVYIPEEERGTLCVSSQVGCALNCTFCATARQGYNRNLTTGEIIAQVWLAIQLLAEESQGSGRRSITNVVMMGMGEPLLNFDAVVSAMRLMLDDHAFGLSRRKVTLSTAGVVPAIDKLRQTLPVSLAVSLHAPDDALRERLVPLNRKYPINQLLEACWRYVDGDGRARVTMEYVMLAGINDRPRHAKALARLLRDKPVKVNLIPFNTVAGIDYERSQRTDINAFRDVLLAADIMTVTRKTRGDDIDAACGQLAGQVHDRTSRRVRLSRAASLQETGSP